MLRGIIAIVANSATHDRPVLLLDKGPVVLLMRPTAGEGDLLLEAVAIQLIVDELGTIVGIPCVKLEGVAFWSTIWSVVG